MKPEGEKITYQSTGVNYYAMDPFKRLAQLRAKETSGNLSRFGMKEIEASRGESAYVWEEQDGYRAFVIEGLGTKNLVADETRRFSGKTHYDAIAQDVALIVVNDVIAQGAMPVIFTDQVEAGDASWYGDKKRSADFANGFVKICREVGMALPAGESATLKYIIKPEAPSLSGSVTGIIAPRSRLITGKKLRAGDRIIGVTSSGLHANGVSLVIKKIKNFLEKLPSGQMLGEAALTPTRSYVSLIEALLEVEVDIHCLLPGTGDGVGKIAFDKRPFMYRINSWPEVPEFFRYFHEELGVSLADCLKTFNWGVGYYIFIPKTEVNRVLDIGRKTGYDLMEVGVVENGKRQTNFLNTITLPPPGEY